MRLCRFIDIQVHLGRVDRRIFDGCELAHLVGGGGSTAGCRVSSKELDGSCPESSGAR